MYKNLRLVTFRYTVLREALQGGDVKRRTYGARGPRVPISAPSRLGLFAGRTRFCVDRTRFCVSRRQQKSDPSGRLLNARIDVSGTPHKPYHLLVAARRGWRRSRRGSVRTAGAAAAVGVAACRAPRSGGRTKPPGDPPAPAWRHRAAEHAGKARLHAFARAGQITCRHRERACEHDQRDDQGFESVIERHGRFDRQHSRRFIQRFS